VQFDDALADGHLLPVIHETSSPTFFVTCLRRRVCGYALYFACRQRMSGSEQTGHLRNRQGRQGIGDSFAIPFDAHRAKVRTRGLRYWPHLFEQQPGLFGTHLAYIDDRKNSQVPLGSATTCSSSPASASVCLPVVQSA
jgi:hypothetical protein